MEIEVKSNRIFKPVHKAKNRYIVMKGSAGSGKSVDTAQMYILRLMSEVGRNLVCVRKSDVTNRDSTFAELVSAVNRMGVSDAWTVNNSPLGLRCRNGNRILFRGVNDDRQREKLKSITVPSGKLTDVWIEEATELTREDVSIIDDRLRGELPPNLFYQIKMTFNPVSATHWIKRDFFDVEDKEVLTHHSTYLDNRFCDEAYKRRMERRKELDPEGYRIYGLGEWGETGGLIFSNFTVEDISIDDASYDSVALGQDFGFNHANAILKIGYKDGDIYILDELYEVEKDSNDIIAIADGRFDKAIIMWCDSAEPDRIKMWQKAGYKARGVKKEQNSVKAQIDWLKGRKIHISPKCQNLIKEMQQWRWKYDDRRAEYLDEPVNFFDDAIAAMRYGVEGWRKNKTVKIISKRQLYGGF